MKQISMTKQEDQDRVTKDKEISEGITVHNQVVRYVKAINHDQQKYLGFEIIDSFVPNFKPDRKGYLQRNQQISDKIEFPFKKMEDSNAIFYMCKISQSGLNKIVKQISDQCDGLSFQLVKPILDESNNLKYIYCEAIAKTSLEEFQMVISQISEESPLTRIELDLSEMALLAISEGQKDYLKLMEKLISLSMSRCKLLSLKNFPESIFPHLTTIDLSYNLIKDEDLKYLKHQIKLKDLNVSNNKIKFLNSFEVLSHLPLINLQIKENPFEQDPMQSLLIKNDFQKMYSIPLTVFRFKTLQKIDYLHEIHREPVYQSYHSYLNHRYPLYSTPSNQHHSNSFLKIINLSHTSFAQTSETQAYLNLFPNISELHLKNCKIQHLSHLPSYKLLKVLLLSQNKQLFDHIVYRIKGSSLINLTIYSESLEEIDLSNNSIDHVSDVQFVCSALPFLNFAQFQLNPVTQNSQYESFIASWIKEKDQKLIEKGQFVFNDGLINSEINSMQSFKRPPLNDKIGIKPIGSNNLTLFGNTSNSLFDNSKSNIFSNPVNFTNNPNLFDNFRKSSDLNNSKFVFSNTQSALDNPNNLFGVKKQSSKSIISKPLIFGDKEISNHQVFNNSTSIFGSKAQSNTQVFHQPELSSVTKNIKPQTIPRFINPFTQKLVKHVDKNKQTSFSTNSIILTEDNPKPIKQFQNQVNSSIQGSMSQQNMNSKASTLSEYIKPHTCSAFEDIDACVSSFLNKHEQKIIEQQIQQSKLNQHFKKDSVSTFYKSQETNNNETKIPDKRHTLFDFNKVNDDEDESKLLEKPATSAQIQPIKLLKIKEEKGQKKHAASAKKEPIKPFKEEKEEKKAAKVCIFTKPINEEQEDSQEEVESYDEEYESDENYEEEEEDEQAEEDQDYYCGFCHSRDIEEPKQEINATSVPTNNDPFKKSSQHPGHNNGGTQTKSHQNSQINNKNSHFNGNGNASSSNIFANNNERNSVINNNANNDIFANNNGYGNSVNNNGTPLVNANNNKVTNKSPAHQNIFNNTQCKNINTFGSKNVANQSNNNVYHSSNNNVYHSNSYVSSNNNAYCNNNAEKNNIYLRQTPQSNNIFNNNNQNSGNHHNNNIFNNSNNNIFNQHNNDKGNQSNSNIFNKNNNNNNIFRCNLCKTNHTHIFEPSCNYNPRILPASQVNVNNIFAPQENADLHQMVQKCHQQQVLLKILDHLKQKSNINIADFKEIVSQNQIGKPSVSAIPTCLSYKICPTIDSLKQNSNIFSRGQGHQYKSVRDFQISNQFGSIYFLENVDLSYKDIDKEVSIKQNIIEIQRGEWMKLKHHLIFSNFNNFREAGRHSLLNENKILKWISKRGYKLIYLDEFNGNLKVSVNC